VTRLLVALGAALAVAAGVYLTLAGDLFRRVMGLALLGSAVNLAVLLAGRVGSMVPPLVPVGAQALAPGAANPLPQALVLTAVVIGFALTALGLLTAVVLRERAGTDDSDAIRLAEPPPRDPVKPPVED
jgi:multisubunit Na+/H+ antiporter MnhC subunit